MPRALRADKPRERKRTGRPCLYSEKTADKVIELLSEARSLRWIGQQLGMPSAQTVLRWMDPESGTFVSGFRERYARAREAAADRLMDEALAIADDGTADLVTRFNRKGEEYTAVDYENVNRSKLRVDTRKWAAAKLAPQKYGERVIAEHTGANGGPIQSVSAIVDVRANMDRIRDRMRLVVDPAPAGEGETTPPAADAGVTTSEQGKAACA